MQRKQYHIYICEGKNVIVVFLNHLDSHIFFFSSRNMLIIIEYVYKIVYMDYIKVIPACMKKRQGNVIKTYVYMRKYILFVLKFVQNIGYSLIISCLSSFINLYTDKRSRSPSLIRCRPLGVASDRLKHGQFRRALQLGLNALKMPQMSLWRRKRH